MAAIRVVELAGGSLFYVFCDNGLWLSAYFVDQDREHIEGWLSRSNKQSDMLRDVDFGKLASLAKVVDVVMESMDSCVFDAGWVVISGSICRRLFATGGNRYTLLTISEHDGHAVIVRCQVDSLIAW